MTSPVPTPESTAAPPKAPLWHTLSAPEVISALDTDPDHGLSDRQVASLTAQWGLNEFEAKEGRSAWEILLGQFGDVMLLMLIAVALVSAGLNIYEGIQSGKFPFPKDALAIFTIVLLNAALGYIQESRAEKALAALKKLSSPRVRVVRDRLVQEIDAKYLVPGDVMLVEAGNQIAADGRLVEAVNLQIQEAALTGEAHAVEKQADVVLAATTSLGDRANSVYQGTEIAQGRGRIIVTATGMRTELGKIAAMIDAVEDEDTPLQRRMEQLGKTLVTGSMILVAIVVIGGTIVLGLGDFRKLLEVSLSMAVAVVPEGLPAVITVTLALGTQRMVKRHALIRKLPTVETLGSVTTICSDKTGTLTQNKMVVQAVELADQSLRVTGTGYEPFGEFQVIDQNGQVVKSCHAETLAQEHPDLQLILVAGVLCNDAILQEDRGLPRGQSAWSIVGDATEGSLLSLAGKANVVQEVWTR